MVQYLAWGSGLAVFGWLITASYQRWLAETATEILSVLGIRASIRGLQAPFTFGLVAYAAMCLATWRAPARVRARALVLGLGAFVAFEILYVAGMTLAVGFLKAHGVQSSSAITRLTVYTVEAVPWLGAPIIWLTLLGTWAVSPSCSGALTGSQQRPLRR